MSPSSRSLPGGRKRDGGAGSFNVTTTIMFMLPLRLNLYTGPARRVRKQSGCFPAALRVQTLRFIFYRKTERNTRGKRERGEMNE